MLAATTYRMSMFNVGMEDKPLQDLFACEKSENGLACAAMDDLLTPIRIRLRGMTQSEREDLARSLGIGFGTIQKIAMGDTENPRIDTWGALAKHFGIVCKVDRHAHH